MATFQFEHLAENLPDRAFVEVDGKYQIVIIRTDEGLIVDVWPKDWDTPFDSLAIHDHDVEELENPDE
jgi:hypothetical protein